MTVTWPQANARRIDRQGLSGLSSADRSPADVVGAMLGAHAQVLSAAELSVALRLPGAVRTDVREALWTDRSLVKTFGPRGTVHLLPAAELPLWTGALSALPTGPGRLTPDARLTPGQTEDVLAAVADCPWMRPHTLETGRGRQHPWRPRYTRPRPRGRPVRWR